MARLAFKPYVIVAGPLAVMRVKRGALEIEGASHMRIDIDDLKPAAVILDGHGEFMSGDALRFCARHGIAVIVPDGYGRALTFIETALEARDGAAGLADVSPSVIRAQCAADPFRIAQAIVKLKIEAELDAIERLYEVERWRERVDASRSLAELRIVEAKCSNAYWRNFREAGLREAKGGNLPRSWLRFAGRNKGAAHLGNQHAKHPLNAMLNYVYVVEAGRLAKALHARGLALTIGFLHSDKAGRNSLVWDCLEPIRSKIDARVFAFAASREWRRADFSMPKANLVRLARPTVAALMAKALLPPRAIAEAADRMLKIIEDAARPEKPIYRPDRRRRPNKARSELEG
jgi:CRISPR-associated endonuclease Cas1